MFSYEVCLPFHVKNTSLCLYSYNLNSFNIIHEREAFFYIFILLETPYSAAFNVMSKIEDGSWLIINEFFYFL